MYRSYKAILEAMINGETTPKNAVRYMYNYKKKGMYDEAAMWYRAKIEFEESYNKINKDLM